MSSEDASSYPYPADTPIQAYPLSLLPPSILDEYSNAIANTISLQRSKVHERYYPESYLTHAVQRWKNILAHPGCRVCTVAIHQKIVAYVTYVPHRQVEDPDSTPYIYLTQFQKLPSARNVQPQKITNLVLSYLESQFDNFYLYGIVMESNTKMRDIYKSYGSRIDSVWHQVAHPEAPKEEGWIGVIYPAPFSHPRVIVLVLQGSEQPPHYVGMVFDCNTIRSHFSKMKDVGVQILDDGFTLETLRQVFVQLQDTGIEKIFLYYTGHGLASDGAFPKVGQVIIFLLLSIMINCSIILSSQFLVPLRDIHTEVQKYFTASIVGADCCNVVQSVPTTKTLPHQLLDQYYDPFNISGHIIFTSSPKGYFSYGGVYLGGSEYTLRFFSVFTGVWLTTLDAMADEFICENAAPEDLIFYHHTPDFVQHMAIVCPNII